MPLLPHPALSRVSRSCPHTPPSPGSHYRSLLEATCEIIKATPYDAGRLFGAYFVKVDHESRGEGVYYGGGR